MDCLFVGSFGVGESSGMRHGEVGSGGTWSRGSGYDRCVEDWAWRFFFWKVVLRRTFNFLEGESDSIDHVVGLST